MNRKPKTPVLSPATTSSPNGQFAARVVLKVPEFGNRYAVAEKTVYFWVRRGMPHMRLSPRKTRIPIAEADRWVEENFLRRHRR